jgi:hypothetical protein
MAKWQPGAAGGPPKAAPPFSPEDSVRVWGYRSLGRVVDMQGDLVRVKFGTAVGIFPQHLVRPELPRL